MLDGSTISMSMHNEETSFTSPKGAGGSTIAAKEAMSAALSGNLLAELSAQKNKQDKQMEQSAKEIYEQQR